MFTKTKLRHFFLSIASEFSNLKFSNLSSLIFTEKNLISIGNGNVLTNLDESSEIPRNGF